MNALTEENTMILLDSLYKQVVDGIPKVSKPVSELAYDYTKRYPDIDVAIKKMLRNQVTKCTITGVMTGLGGAITLPAAISADIGSVLYVQLRMIAVTAYMSGYELDSDQTKTFVYACLAGVSIDKVLADAGIKFSMKFAESMIKKIPGEVLTKINRAVGFRFVTKFGEKGIINLGRMIPAVGGVVGGGFNLAETKLIANRAYKSFFEADITAFGDCKEESQSPSDDGILQGMQDDITGEFFEYEFHGEE